MLKKRFIGVVTVKDGWAVQSFGYSRYLPLGRPECLIENLDRWGADEILLQVIDRSAMNAGPDYQLLESVANLGLGTPLIYAGGIRSVDDGVKVIQSGADRLAVDAIIHDDLAVLSALSERLGRQAIIASLPMVAKGNEIELFDYRSTTTSVISASLANLIQEGAISEVLLIDPKNEGVENGFDVNLVKQFPNTDVPLIIFGGISSIEQMKYLFSCSNVVAVSVGNFLSYREHAVQQFKEGLSSSALRPSTYAITQS